MVNPMMLLVAPEAGTECPGTGPKLQCLSDGTEFKSVLQLLVTGSVQRPAVREPQSRKDRAQEVALGELAAAWLAQPAAAQADTAPADADPGLLEARLPEAPQDAAQAIAARVLLDEDAATPVPANGVEPRAAAPKQAAADLEATVAVDPRAVSGQGPRAVSRQDPGAGELPPVAEPTPLGKEMPETDGSSLAQPAAQPAAKPEGKPEVAVPPGAVGAEPGLEEPDEPGALVADAPPRADRAETPGRRQDFGHARPEHGHAPRHLGVETVPAEWRFDPSARNLEFPGVGPKITPGAPPALVDTEPTGGETASSSGEGKRNTEPAPPAPTPFADTIREVSHPRAQVQGAENSEPHVRVIDQVVREVRLHRFQDGSDIVIRLSPPELGTLRVRVTQDAAGFTTRIDASSDHVRGLLQAHLPALTEALSGAGLRMESVSVSYDSSFADLAQNSGQGNAYGRSDDGRHGAMFGHNGGARGLFGSAPGASRGLELTGYNWLA